MLTGFKRLTNELSMAVVSGRNHDCIDLWISKDVAGIGARLLKAMCTTCVYSSCTAGRRNRMQPNSGFFKRRNQNLRCVVAGADKGDDRCRKFWFELWSRKRNYLFTEQV